MSATGTLPSSMPEPRRWWDGPLDVERLAWASVLAVRDAVRRVCASRGQSHDIATDPALVAASFAAIDHLRVDGRPAQAWAPLSGFFAASDGWVRLHANYPHHAQAIVRALGTSDRAHLESVIAAMPAREVEHRVTASGGIGVRVRSGDEWTAHPHAEATRNAPWARTERAGVRRSLSGGSLPLDGVRVLDLTRVIAGPTCSQVLGCLGADVLRIDPPGRPELRDQYLSNGMGKRSVELDLATDCRAIERLLGDADVVLLGYRPGALDRFGLAPDRLRDRFPELVIGVLSAWGEDGPWGHRPGFDSIVQAATGIAQICGTADRPGALPVQALDHATGHLLAAGVVDLLADGSAGTVHVNLLGAARRLLSWPAPPRIEPAELPVRTVLVTTDAGPVTTVPPPLTVDGAPLVREIGEYGAAEPRWRD